MTACEVSRPAPFRCPTPAEVLASILALLPQGRAWQSNEGGPISGLVGGFEKPPAFDGEAFQTRTRAASVLHGFWRSIAEVVTFINRRFCDLRLEFWCATQRETRDLWMAEYGLPDACDPFPDLCAKVAAVGGTRCDYYAAIAARAGWSIECEQSANNCVASAGSFQAGCDSPAGSLGGARILIRVFLDDSLAYVAPLQSQPYAGAFQAGRALACPPNYDALRCILERIVHAHIEISYETIGG